MKLKIKPWARGLKPTELWPEAEKPAQGPRPLKPGEQIEEGATVYVTIDGGPACSTRAYRFAGWQWCGRQRYALLDSGEGWQNVVIDSRVRL